MAGRSLSQMMRDYKVVVGNGLENLTLAMTDDELEKIAEELVKQLEELKKRWK